MEIVAVSHRKMATAGSLAAMEPSIQEQTFGSGVASADVHETSSAGERDPIAIEPGRAEPKDPIYIEPFSAEPKGFFDQGGEGAEITANGAAASEDPLRTNSSGILELQAEDSAPIRALLETKQSNAKRPADPVGFLPRSFAYLSDHAN